MSRIFVAVAICFGSTSLMGCLITQDPSFDEPANFPPYVLGTAESPTSEVVFRQVGAVDVLPGDAGVADPSLDDVRITASIRDENVRDDLVARVFLNLDRDVGLPNQFLIEEVDIPASGTVERLPRPTFTIPRSLLVPNCNRVEIHVSREFRRFPSLEPVEDGMGEGTRRDLGTGVWFIGGFNDGNPTPTMNGCEVDR